MQNEAYQKLMDNLCDIVAEEQAKLGYMKEPIRLYYPCLLYTSPSPRD